MAYHRSLPVISARTIQVQKTLGSGGYGIVHEALHAEWGTVAYKQLYAQHIKERDMRALKKEAEIQWELQHPNVVKILALIFEPGNYGVVLEFVEHGEVFDYIQDHNPDLTFKISIVYDVCLAMCYLHSLSPPIIHGDLKVENILVGGNLRAKVCDFGFAQWKQYSQSHSSESVRLGTVTHVPPELWRDSCLKKDETFDVYGYGVCIWEIITAEKPFKGGMPNVIKEWVLDNQRPDTNLIPPEVPLKIVSLMKRCWSQIKSDRPMFSNIKRELEDQLNTISETAKYSKLANTKLENNNDAGSPSISTVKPGSSTTENTAHQNTPKVVRSDRAEPALIKSPKLNVKHTLTFNPSAVAIWNDKLYIQAPGSPDIDVYNADPFVYRRIITVHGMKNPHDIVASENVLYVSERVDKLIHRIQLPELCRTVSNRSVSNRTVSNRSVSNWTVDGIELKLSIAKNGNVIVASCRPAKIFEYTSVGNLVREIVVNRIDANLIGLRHAIQMEGDKFIVCHSETTHDRVCMIDNTGRVIKCYGGNPGSGTGQLNMPYYLAIDRNGFILVADCFNNRIVQLNSSLEYIGETVGIQKPVGILLNEERRRLYVIEINDKSLTVFDV